MTQLTTTWQEALSLAKEARIIGTRMDDGTLTLELRDPMGQTFSRVINSAPGVLTFPGLAIPFKPGIQVRAIQGQTGETHLDNH